MKFSNNAQGDIPSHNLYKILTIPYFSLNNQLTRFTLRSNNINEDSFQFRFIMKDKKKKSSSIIIPLQKSNRHRYICFAPRSSNETRSFKRREKFQIKQEARSLFFFFTRPLLENSSRNNGERLAGVVFATAGQD